LKGVIILPSNLFFGTGIPACILILNKNKSKKQKNKIIFIYAAEDYEDLKKRVKLRKEDIEKIFSAYNNFERIENYCHVANADELKEAKYVLHISNYLDTSKPVKRINLKETILILDKQEQEDEESEKKVKDDLKKLGFDV